MSEEIRKRFPIGAIVCGSVVSHRHFGFFVDIGLSDVPGLVQITDFADSVRVTVDQFPPIGTKVSAIVLGYRFSDPDYKQIWLGMKQSQLAIQEMNNSPG